MEGLQHLRGMLDALNRIHLPSLNPPIQELPPQESLFRQAQTYSYAAVAHVRATLRALVHSAEAGNSTAAFVLSRDLVEWTAYICYVNRRRVPLLEKCDFQGLSDLLPPIPGWGSSPQREEAEVTKIAASVRGGEFPEEAIREYERYQEETYGQNHGSGVYGFIQENCSAAGFGWGAHCAFIGNKVRFTDGPDSSPLPLVAWAVIDFVMIVSDLLAFSGESLVRTQLETAAIEFSKIGREQRFPRRGGPANGESGSLAN